MADRYHLVQNLREHLQQFLDRKRTCLPEIEDLPLKAVSTDDRGLLSALETQTSVMTSCASHCLVSTSSTEQPQEQVQPELPNGLVQLREEGLTYQEIARRLGMGERTVRYWLTRGIPYGKPELRRKRRSGFDPYAAYVRERWEQGCHNGLQLWRELQTQGYKGGSRTVYRFLATLREGPAPSRGKAQRSQAVPESPVEQWTAQKAVWLFIRDPIQLGTVGMAWRGGLPPSEAPLPNRDTTGAGRSAHPLPHPRPPRGRRPIPNPLALSARR